jgi:ribosomal protein L32
MLSQVDCPKCGEFRTNEHVCDNRIPPTIGEITKMVYEATHPEEAEEE